MTNEYPKKKISAIDDLLRILEEHAADTQLKADLAYYRRNFDSVYPQFHTQQLKTNDMISEYRNSLLHGEALWQLFFAALTNFVCIMLSSLISKSDYDSKYPQLIQKINQNYSMRGDDLEARASAAEGISLTDRSYLN